jgi:hypothetical protein
VSKSSTQSSFEAHILTPIDIEREKTNGIYDQGPAWFSSSALANTVRLVGDATSYRVIYNEENLNLTELPLRPSESPHCVWTRLGNSKTAYLAVPSVKCMFDPTNIGR